ncbi:hypothetical protein, partial [Micromonospora andamanensis]|uniref:hypothetical protein n=1 Tax=Micromonospora andamanensis TaxID=1287068 RepID=UPI00194E911D
GFERATAARDALLRMMDKTMSKAKIRSHSTVVGAVDIRTGNWVAAAKSSAKGKSHCSETLCRKRIGEEGGQAQEH